MLTEMGGDAIPALAQAAGEATFDRTVDLATAMLSETGLHERLRARIEAEITDDTRVLVAHSPGTVLSYSALAAHDDWPVHTFVTLGSPLAVPMSSTAWSLRPSKVSGSGPVRCSAGSTSGRSTTRHARPAWPTTSGHGSRGS